MNQMKVSDYIAKFLLSIGCNCIFGYQGGAVTHLIDSIYKYKDIKFINTYHEQAAAFAAEGYARIKNSIGTAIATSGPGATNLITGIGSAYFDSIPCLYLTGQVNTYEYKDNLPVRQRGFQETDIVSIVNPITKYAVRITEPENIGKELKKAVYIACSDRKGPVLLDIPMNVQRSQITSSLPSINFDDCTDTECSPQQVDKAIDYINNSSRPVILVGGGVRLSGSVEILNKIVNILKIPIVSSLMGKDAIDNNLENYIGMIGVYGNRSANFTIANSDLVIAIGTRLDTRQTGTLTHSFAREAKLIRIDIDVGELSHKIKKDEYSIKGDIKRFLEELYLNIANIDLSIEDWYKKTKNYKQNYSSYSCIDFNDPNYIMEKISSIMKPGDILCTDVGQNQMWSAQSIHLTKNQRFLTSGGMGAMGFSLPCAIGAYYGKKMGRVIVITGDGGIQMNIQELELIKRNNIPIKIIVMNNHSLGMIRHFQEMYFECRYNATISDYEAPDFCSLAKAYGIKSCYIDKLEDLEILSEVLDDDAPILIEISLPQHTYVRPKLAVNKPIEEQDPQLSSEEFSKNMIIKPFNFYESINMEEKN